MVELESPDLGGPVVRVETVKYFYRSSGEPDRSDPYLRPPPEGPHKQVLLDSVFFNKTDLIFSIPTDRQVSVNSAATLLVDLSKLRFL